MRKKIIIFWIFLIVVLPIQLIPEAHQILKKPNEPKINLYCYNSNISSLLNQVNNSLLLYYVEKFVSFGSKKIGSVNCRNTAEWIHHEFDNMGLTTYFDDWSFPPYNDRNVIAIHEGIDLSSDLVFVICAHYDTKGDRFFVEKGKRHSADVYAGYCCMMFFDQKDRYNKKV